LNEDAKIKLMNTRSRILITHPWYGVVISKFVFKESCMTPTIGVRIMSNRDVECVYNPEFILHINKVDNLIAILIHEVEHIIRMHVVRGKNIESQHNFFLYNLACDWVINGYKNKKRISNLLDEAAYIPNDNSVFANYEELRPNWTSDEFYEWLKKQNLNEDRNEDEGEGGIGGIGGIDDHTIWKESTASKDEIRSIAKSLAEQATLSCGSMPGSLIEHIENLKESKNNWFYFLRNILGRSVGGKRLTYTKRNRRRDQFGIKGSSSHAKINLTIMVDVSGSMTTNLLNKVFGEIEAVSRHFKIKLIQFDHEVSDVRDYHKGDWKKIEIKGRGGTSFKHPFDYIEKNKLVGKMNIIMTDGYASYPEEKTYPVTWLFVGKSGYNFAKSVGLNWGHHIIIPSND
jgi:predicted metal-dependent peptidase